jgi:hypothetical protein
MNLYIITLILYQYSICFCIDLLISADTPTINRAVRKASYGVVLAKPFLHLNQCVRSSDSVTSGTNKHPFTECFGGAERFTARDTASSKL